MELQITPIIDKADSLYALGMVNSALDIYEAVLQISEDAEVCAKILYNMSDCYKKLGMYNLAITALDSLLAYYPQKIEELNMDYHLGNLNFIAQNYQKAAKYLSLYLTKNPKSEKKGKVEFQLAYANQQNGNYLEAIDFYKKAMKDLPLISDYALYYMAQCLHHLGDCSGSLEVYEKIQNEYAQCPLTINIEEEIADCYYDNELFDEAAESYQNITKKKMRKASELKKARIYFRLAQSYEKSGNHSKAIKYYSYITETFSETSYAYQSIKTLEKLKANFNHKNYYIFAEVCYNNGYYYEAIDRFKTFIKKYPANKKADNAQYWIAKSYDKSH